MTLAILLNLLVGTLIGVLVPFMLERAGRDPAIGSSVLLTFSTDSLGFLIFLGLATIFFSTVTAMHSRRRLGQGRRDAHWSAPRATKLPDFPPCFSSSRTDSITMPRSTALHMS